MSNNLLNKVKVIAVVGPTASGKTAYSIDLAKNIGGEIISADSRLVYKYFNVATAKPTIDEMQDVPHYMIDIVEPTFEYSVGLYQQQAKSIIYDISKRGNIPIIVGGTGLYIDALLKNYDIPKFEPDYEFRKKMEQIPVNDLYEMFLKKNNFEPSNIDQNDKKKIIRALEIMSVTGKTLSEIRKMSESEFEIEWIGRNFERNILYDRINSRVDIMLQNGLVEETKFLLSKYGRIPNLIYTIGYKEIIDYLDNIISLDIAINRLKQNTRNYAKRQLTWFRRNDEIKWNIYPKLLKK